MRLLLDQGLPRSTVSYLHAKGIESMHAGEVGLATASDAAILAYSREQGLIVATLDADFHAQLAVSRAAGPSVIRIRIEGLRGQDLANLLAEVLKACAKDLADGAMISVSDAGIRVRRIPLLR